MAADTDTQKTMTLTDNESGSSVELPVIDGSVGPDVLDIRKLYGETGMFTFDPGYGATGSCKSGLTYIDGDKGVLLHRGYPIESLANQSDFLEVAYLLLEGELPNAEQKAEFDNAITRHTMVHEQLSIFYRGFRRDATRWPSCAASLARCRPSITTRPIFRTRRSGQLPRGA